ncbi:MAG: site-specific DNA-methyltransferase [Eubacteriaceae bacterium]|nr:site-specific DNA-methyltransferase [Eubacteriaceae bacterium]
MDKLKMHSINKVDDNIEKIENLFPNCVTEAKVDGVLTKVVDFDKLKQELSDYVVEGRDERYQFTWPDKKQSILLANAPIAKTLRPCVEESVDFDSTQNLYIEGDNLDVLKLLQETYLGKVKMIYIDPPYNTGNDFVYEDDFAQNTGEYLANSGQFDEEGNRLVKNLDSNGRFHTDWLNMIYPRLKLAKDLLTDDGVIFISIDDNEVENLKKICNEIFGEKNYIGNVTWEKRTKCQNTETAKDQFQSKTEYILVYKKQFERMRFNLEITGKKIYELQDVKGQYREKVVEEMSSLGMRGRATMIFPIKGIMPGEGKQWKVGQEQVKNYEERDDVLVKGNKVYFKVRPEDENSESFAPLWSHFFDKEAYGTAETGKAELSTILGTKSHGFETVKPVSLIKKLVFHIKKTNNISVISSDIILDFFSGSATTAHAVMQLNAEDGGNRKFMMVQIPEATDEKSEAYKAGYQNICDIGKERIRRAGNKIKEEAGLLAQDLDTGFRVLKLDSTNMKDVFYTPEDTNISMFEDLTDNIKDDRSPEDLLFQMMLDLGVLLSSKVETNTIDGKNVFSVADGFLMACFDKDLTDKTVEAIARQKPYYFVMRDYSMATDSVAANFDQIFAAYSPDTVRKVL